MPLYPMQCVIPDLQLAKEESAPAWCGHKWDWYSSVGMYRKSEGVAFRNVQCPRCGRNGARRIYPPDASPGTISCRGTWGPQSPVGLRGKSFLSKEERDEQLRVFGDRQQTVVDVEGRGELTGGTRRKVPEKKVEPRKWEATIAADPEEAPSEEPCLEGALFSYLSENGPTKKAQIIADHEELNPYEVQRALNTSRRIARVKHGWYGVQ